MIKDDHGKPKHSMVMVYLPTSLGYFEANVGRYTMHESWRLSGKHMANISFTGLTQLLPVQRLTEKHIVHHTLPATRISFGPMDHTLICLWP